MTNAQQETKPPSVRQEATGNGKASRWEKLGILYARVALGAAFLSAVSARFGLWDRTLDMKHFAKFIEYAAQVNSFLPLSMIPAVAWTATVAETSLSLLLIIGLWPRAVAFASAILLAMFGTAMAISFGLESPFDYSVFSASGAAVLLGLIAIRHDTRQSPHFSTERPS